MNDLLPTYCIKDQSLPKTLSFVPDEVETLYYCNLVHLF